jgi:uncharacterized membrane protein YfcA
MTLASQVPWLIAVGFAAQLIDGCVGMGYGSGGGWAPLSHRP